MVKKTETACGAIGAANSGNIRFNKAMLSLAKEDNMSGVTFPTCPVCMRGMYGPIYMCLTGHSVCADCTEKMRPQQCPECRQSITKMRNRLLEDLINKTKIPCPNRAAGCPLVPEISAIHDHAQECILRNVKCPVAVGKTACSWIGRYNKFADHAAEMHPNEFKVGSEVHIVMGGITRESDRRVHIVSHSRNVFIVTFKIDSRQRMVYWTVQLMGPKKYSHQFHYEIQLSSKRDPQKKITFKERCWSEYVRADSIFNQCSCAVLPLDSLAHFTTDYRRGFKLAYKLFIRNNSVRNSDNPSRGESSQVSTVILHSSGSSSGSNDPGNHNGVGSPPENSEMGA